MHSIVGLLFMVVGQLGYPLAILAPDGTDAAVERSTVAGGGPAIGPPGPFRFERPRYRPVEVRVDGAVVSTTLAEPTRHAFEIDTQSPRLVQIEVETRVDSFPVRAESVLQRRRYRFGTPATRAWPFAGGSSGVVPKGESTVHVDARGLTTESIVSVHPSPEEPDTQTQWTWTVLPRESMVFEIAVTEFESVAEFVAARHASPRSWHEAWRLAHACNLFTDEPHLVRAIVAKGFETVPEESERGARVRAVLMHQLALAETSLRETDDEIGDAAALAEEALAKALGKSTEAVRRAELFRGAAHALDDSFVRGERMAPWHPSSWAISVLAALVEENAARDQALGTGRNR